MNCGLKSDKTRIFGSFTIYQSTQILLKFYDDGKHKKGIKSNFYRVVGERSEDSLIHSDLNCFFMPLFTIEKLNYYVFDITDYFYVQQYSLNIWLELVFLTRLNKQ